jgi:hypothetical protein
MAARLGLDNIRFRCALFAEIADPAAADQDYVTAQGVLAWVSPANRAHLGRIAARHLRPGGIACLGYNSMPGWAGGLAFQKMIRVLAEDKPGTALQRYEAAFEQLGGLAAAGAQGLNPGFAEWVEGLRGRVPAAYFPHEYLNSHWQPLWSSDVHEAMAVEGLAFVGTSRNETLRPDFILRKAQRAALDGIAGAAAREAAMDVMLNQSFRIDLFTAGVRLLGDSHAERMAGWWAVLKPAAEIVYATDTPAGTVKFDNEAARALTAALETGPMRVADVAAQGFDGTGADLLNALDALWLAGIAIPCDPPAETDAAAPFNAGNRETKAVAALVGRHGAMPVEMAALATDAAATLARLGIG